MRNIRSFTLIEMVVAGVIVSVIAGLSLVGYQRVLEIASARDAINVSYAIKAAEEIYKEKNGKYWPDANGAYYLDELNAALGTNIDPENLYIWCDADGADYSIYDCCIYYPKTGSKKWKYEIKSTYTKPRCAMGTCPLAVP